MNDRTDNPVVPDPRPTRNRPGIVLLTSHWLSLVGLVFVITTISTWLFVVPSEMHGQVENPYKGTVVYLILPFIGFAGVVLTAAGMVLGRRRIRKRLETEVTDRRSALQRLVAFLVIIIGANLLIGTQFTYRAVKYMDTPQFCGAACHVMKPQYLGHQDSNHASVACAECHIAPSAGGWIEAKMNGTRQLWQTITNSYPRPVPSALESGRLVPSKETCERCHWAEKIVATRLLVIPTYADDEKNTDSYNVLMMMVGGSKMQGIHHAHFAGGFEIRYAAADPKRQTIPWVERRDTKTGETQNYLATGTTAEQAAGLQKFTMQCVDCHDRPTHAFSPPDRALDRALALGQVPATLPFIKKEGLTVLQATYSSSAEAEQKIPAAITTYYRETHPAIYGERKADIEAAAKGVLAIYNRNVFPDLKVSWGSYPNNLGHTESPGCFRCHDNSHATPDGKRTIAQDCTSCHQLLAMQQSSPEILKTLGVWNQIEALRQR
jgi:nitrate/TMAO reductase-like tetraheme cytochrome c subunit